MMTREEHLQWCKNRALELLDAGHTQQALTSMMSDTSKHPQTAGHAGNELGMMLLLTGNLNTPDEMRKHIEGYQ